MQEKRQRASDRADLVCGQPMIMGGEGKCQVWSLHIPLLSALLWSSDGNVPVIVNALRKCDKK